MTEITEIFNVLFNQFGTLAWWYALAVVVATWLGVILTLVVIIFFVKAFFETF